MTREEMMDRMSSREFYQWMAVARIAPFGDRRSDIHLGILRAQLLNMFARDKGQPAFKTEDWIPYFGIPRQEETFEEKSAKFVAHLNAIVDAQEKRKLN